MYMDLVLLIQNAILKGANIYKPAINTFTKHSKPVLGISESLCHLIVGCTCMSLQYKGMTDDCLYRNVTYCLSHCSMYQLDVHRRIEMLLKKAIVMNTATQQDGI